MGDVLKPTWFVWSVRVGKFDIVKKYLEEEVSEVKSILFPTLTDEKVLKNGTIKKKKQALYGGYMFLLYSHNIEDPQTWWKINKHPFITTYVGPCTATDLVSVKSLQKLDSINKDKSKKFYKEDTIRVNGGVFKDYKGVVVDTTMSAVKVELALGDKIVKAAFSPEDLDIVERKK